MLGLAALRLSAAAMFLSPAILNSPITVFRLWRKASVERNRRELGIESSSKV